MALTHEHNVVYGLFETRAALETAVGRLKGEGFLSSDISTLLPTAEGSTEFSYQPEDQEEAKGAEPLGGALGWLAGIGTLSIPGLGPFVAAGPILATLGGTGIADALVAMGIPEYDAKRFEFFVKDGCMLLSVHAGLGEWADKTKMIFMECGAHDVSSTGDEQLFKTKSKDTSTEKRF